MTPPLLPLCEDCDQRPRAHRSRRCDPCRAARKASQKSAWQRQNRDAHRASKRPLQIPRDKAQATLAAASAAFADLIPLRDHLARQGQRSSQARQAAEDLNQALRAWEQLRDLLTTADASRLTPSQRGASKPMSVPGPRV